MDFRNPRNTKETIINILSSRWRKRGDILFGHNKSGLNYPKEFYKELRNAVNRGVNINFIIPKNSDSESLLNFLLDIESKNVEIHTSDEDYIRLFGIRGKEVMFVLPSANDYTAILRRVRDNSMLIAENYPGANKEYSSLPVSCMT